MSQTAPAFTARWFALGVAVATLAGCRSGDAVCAGTSGVSFLVTVRDAQTGAVIRAPTITVAARGSASNPTLTFRADSSAAELFFYSGGGTYDVTITKSGYQSAARSLVAATSQCSTSTQALDVTLSR